ncbi:MAG: hypothetical protein AVDCRST_MAG93-2170 [uncultured Chloroflexia bacterium]|uniref:Uncharacterized protein n=1 Tax=uncultured Chloroflexia bacterium TaxID=1672391 RepID=A0A6J4ISF8_9CHLR|nr:MAG: hypothetical protein AVDCRST_MAG93-2170 [uncultured Chloroflexia bacterium]
MMRNPYLPLAVQDDCHLAAVEFQFLRASAMNVVPGDVASAKLSR